jgi:acetolactate synthase I/II/III large subunit
MNGAESLLRTLLAGNIDVCFMNPGTSEMQFVSALDRVPAMRGVLCLYEGVCSGAADGYARMLRRPAATLLHLGPGLANGLSNFHNARKARSPIISIVGEHSTQHLPYNAPLTADTAGFARPVSAWVTVLESADSMGESAAEAIDAACAPPGQVATLIVPADFSWSEAGAPGRPAPAPPRSQPSADTIHAAAERLRFGRESALFLSGSALLAPALEIAGRLASAAGIRVFADRFAARLDCGRGIFAPQRIPYFPEAAGEMLAGVKQMVLVEAQAPVSFFGYPGRRSLLAPEDCECTVLAREHEDGPAALQALLAGFDARAAAPTPSGSPELPGPGPLTLDAIGRAAAALLPEGTIVSDEMVSSGEPIAQQLALAAPHHHLPVTGGSIGQGLPVALGAAYACPDRKVVAFEADGSAMYTLQALWTMARERLDVVTVILANRRYRILEIETRRTGAGEPGPRARQMMDIGQPVLDFVRLAEAQGVPACRVETAEEFTAAFRQAMRERGPYLIEAVIA